MQVRVKYFGITSLRTGIREETVYLPAGTTLAELKALLDTQYGLNREAGIFYNVNGKGVSEEQIPACRLAEDDVIMVIPQISGG